MLQADSGSLVHGTLRKCLFALALIIGIALMVPAKAQSSDVCDQLSRELPDQVSQRVDAGRACVEALPGLPAPDQIRISREYARTLPGYIDTSELDTLAAQLVPEAALPLRAHAARSYSAQPDEPSTQRLKALTAQVRDANDPLATAHLEFAWANRIFRLGGDHSEMERRLRLALNLAREHDITGLVPFTHNALAVRAKADGEYVLAVEEYRQALAAFEANGDKAATGIVYSNIANIFSDLGDNLQAIRMYQRAIGIYDEFEPDVSPRRLISKVNLAAAYSQEGEFERADATFRDVRNDNAVLGDRRLGGFIDYQHALALYGLERRTEAISMAEQSVPQIIENRDPSEAATALTWLAARYIEDRRLDDAQSALGRAREIMEPGDEGAEALLENPGNTYWTQEYAEGMGALMVELGQPKQASEYFKAALQLSNDRFEKEKVEAISNSGLLFELRDRDERIQRMNDRARIAELELSQSRLQTILGFALAAAIGLLAYTIFRSFRFQQRLAASKDTFLTEIHHRTKNNLQLLTSLFNMDARHGVSAREAKQRQLEAASRARTMAILHDHIYSRSAEDEREIDIKGFIERLLELLEESFGREGIILERQIQSAKVDLDRITPLGLLICELVTNAYKHAFGDEGGTIALTLIDKGKSVELVIEDNGKGIPDIEGENGSDGIGMTLIADLADQLGASRSIRTGATGTVWAYDIAKTQT